MVNGMIARHLVVATTAGQRVVPLPRQAEPTRPEMVVPSCRPLRLDNRWHLAHLDTTANALLIDSVDDDGVIVQRSIGLDGEWAEAIGGGRTYIGTVDLYQHGDRVVAHICTVDGGAQCAFTDLSFDRALLAVDPALTTSAHAESAATPPRFYPPNDHTFGPSELLFQLGDQLWRADHDEIAGECDCGEGGDSAPYYSWVGGTFDGAADVAPTRTADFSLLNGRVIRCGSDSIPESAAIRDEPGFIEPDTTRRCEVRDDEGLWEPLLGSETVDWATVPDCVAVRFVERDEQGRILVAPLGG